MFEANLKKKWNERSQFESRGFVQKNVRIQKLSWLFFPFEGLVTAFIGAKNTFYRKSISQDLV